MGVFSKIKQGYSDFQADRDKKRAEEEARQNDILSGNIQPIQTNINLEADEKAYAIFNAQRTALVSHTVSTQKKKGVLGRAVVGGVLLGPLGALGGAATAGSKITEKTNEQKEKIDTGSMIFTNKRFIFVGKNSMVSIQYDKAVDVRFNLGLVGNSLTISYSEMLRGEHYLLSGDRVKDCELIFKGIKNIK